MADVSKEPVRVAVLGTGSIGWRHLAVLKSMPNVRPIAVPLRLERRAELAREGYDVCGNIEQALAAGARIAFIATDTSRHAKDALAALKLGMHLMVEKPLACTASEARPIRDGAATAHTVVAVGCVLRFSTSLNEFRRLLPAIGPLHSVRIVCHSYLPDWRPQRPYREGYSARANEGGVLRDLIHEIDYAGWLFGWPTTLQAKVRNTGRLGIDSDEAADLLWETPGGAIVSISLDYLSRPQRRGIQAFGSEGLLEWDAETDVVELQQPGRLPSRKTLEQELNAQYEAQAASFLRAAGGAAEPDLARAEVGVRALAICDAARRASENRREEPVDYS